MHIRPNGCIGYPLTVMDNPYCHVEREKTMNITFDTPLPASIKKVGRQSDPWENDLAPVRAAVLTGNVPGGRYVIVERFSVDKNVDEDASKKLAVSMAGKINRRMARVEKGWHAKAWPLPNGDGKPDSELGFACWVRYNPVSEVVDSENEATEEVSQAA